MAQLLEFNYALIDETGFCYEVRSTSRNCDGEEGYISIPEYSDEYIFKFYDINTEKWYYDEGFTEEVEELN